MNEQDAERATQFLVDTAYKYGEAVAASRKAEHMIKHTLAMEEKAAEKRGHKSAAAQKREALASSEYVAAVERSYEAELESRKLQASREAAAIRVDFWRSVNARQRGA
jgi:hypothetical protein